MNLERLNFNEDWRPLWPQSWIPKRTQTAECIQAVVFCFHFQHSWFMSRRFLSLQIWSQASLMEMYLLPISHHSSCSSDHVLSGSFVFFFLLCFFPKNMLFFVFLGQHSDQRMDEETEAEANMFKDLVIFNFLDTYRNLTVKNLCSLHFVNIAFDAKYVCKSDDDVLPKLKQILSFVSHFKINSSNAIFGHVWRKAYVQRKGKWALSTEEYPPKFYPDYCTGGLYFLTMGAVKALLAANNNIPLIPIEDAAMGILALKSGQVKLIHVPLWFNQFPKKHDLETCSKHYVTNNVPLANILKLWNSCSGVGPTQGRVTNQTLLNHIWDQGWILCQLAVHVCISSCQGVARPALKCRNCGEAVLLCSWTCPSVISLAESSMCFLDFSESDNMFCLMKIMQSWRIFSALDQLRKLTFLRNAQYISTRKWGTFSCNTCNAPMPHFTWNYRLEISFTLLKTVLIFQR